MSGSTAGTWAAAFDAVGKLVGHQVELRTRRYGKTAHYWVECDCGYESGHGRSFRFAMSSGVGHIQRVSKGLEPPAGLSRDTPAVVEIPQDRLRPA